MTMKTGNSLPEQLRQIGLCAVPAQLDDFLARAAKARWSPHQLLEELTRAETAERSRRSLERRLRLSGVKSFKPMADFDWAWPTQIERNVIENALTLDFLSEARNLVLMGGNGLGKTMIAQNLCHQAVLAGYSVSFRSAAALRRNHAALCSCHDSIISSLPFRSGAVGDEESPERNSGSATWLDRLQTDPNHIIVAGRRRVTLRAAF